MKIWLVLDLLDVLREASRSSNVWRTVYCNPTLCVVLSEGDCFYNTTDFECSLDQSYHIAFP